MENSYIFVCGDGGVEVHIGDFLSRLYCIVVRILYIFQGGQFRTGFYNTSLINNEKKKRKTITQIEYSTADNKI